MKISTRKLIKKIIITTVMSMPVFNVQSAIIDYDTYFSDTETGLNWLDVTATVNRSYNDIASQFDAGGEFDGWRYATKSEFTALLSNWTGVSPNDSGRTMTTGTTPSVDGLVELFGSTLDSAWTARFGQTWDSLNGYDEGFGIDFTLGILSETFNDVANQRQVAAIWDNENNGQASDFFNAEHRQVFVSDAKVDIGSFLVQGQGQSAAASAVPEPQTILIFVLGLLGLSISRSRKALAFVSH
mgnify:FL=1